jgi:hypothetical protein
MKKIDKKIVLHLIKFFKLIVGVKFFSFIKKIYFLTLKEKIELNNNIVYFLHIGKAGGTILKSIFKSQKNQQNDLTFIGLPERVKLYQLDSKQKYIFSIRNPIERYLSAFTARKKKSNIWSKEYYSIEGIGFYLYNDANILAEDLYSRNLIKIFKSRICMRCIPIINENIFTWFTVKDLKKNPPLFFFENSTINEDWKNFSIKFNFNENDMIKHMHMRNKTLDKKDKLSELAKINLKRYYKKDFEIYKYCLKLKNL